MGPEGGYDVQLQILSADDVPFIRLENLMRVVAELTLGCLLFPWTCAWRSLVRVREGAGVSGVRFVAADWSHCGRKRSGRCGYGEVSGDGLLGRVSGYWDKTDDCEIWVTPCDGLQAERGSIMEGGLRSRGDDMLGL